MPFVVQTPDSILDWSFNWALFLDDVGSPSDTINTSVWEITPEPGSPISDVIFDDDIVGAKTTVSVQNLQPGVIYMLSNEITTAQGRKRDRRITIRCEKQ